MNFAKELNYKETIFIIKDTSESIILWLFIISLSECKSGKNKVHTNYMSSITQKQFSKSVKNPYCFMPNSLYFIPANLSFQKKIQIEMANICYYHSSHITILSFLQIFICLYKYCFIFNYIQGSRQNILSQDKKIHHGFVFYHQESIIFIILLYYWLIQQNI